MLSPTVSLSVAETRAFMISRDTDSDYRIFLLTTKFGKCSYFSSKTTLVFSNLHGSKPWLLWRVADTNQGCIWEGGLHPLNFWNVNIAHVRFAPPTFWKLSVCLP